MLTADKPDEHTQRSYSKQRRQAENQAVERGALRALVDIWRQGYGAVFQAYERFGRSEGRIRHFLSRSQRPPARRA